MYPEHNFMSLSKVNNFVGLRIKVKSLTKLSTRLHEPKQKIKQK